MAMLLLALQLHITDPGCHTCKLELIFCGPLTEHIPVKLQNNVRLMVKKYFILKYFVMGLEVQKRCAPS